jgi:hypothetical protein
VLAHGQHREKGDDARDVEEVLERPQAHVPGSEPFGMLPQDREEQERGREGGGCGEEEEQGGRDDPSLLGGEVDEVVRSLEH